MSDVPPVSTSVGIAVLKKSEDLAASHRAGGRRFRLVQPGRTRPARPDRERGGDAALGPRRAARRSASRIAATRLRWSATPCQAMSKAVP